ncbi:hypothetical protein BLS_001130 [Venturia inaequalis]|uniref:Uncharacterized protein n=1 Tax=Venturia inaequalis TaxID=5025 RepID=A0A8H3YR91_VENIN|nr:hypothetical protein BLS_001130 [Venturia inaequalis]KAE9966611.1 hypothetical protein EG328_008797 [Venturia inaequalis]KAE9976503.1 hypothetical protein EG327_008019 [Venturia inaequalis]RDI77823.1 hypothetical protein Vi05172_g12117 [Venturia inaequalis]
MGFLRKSKAPVEHPLNAFMAQVTSKPQAPSKPPQYLAKVCVCTGPCSCDAILNFTGDSPSRPREARSLPKKSTPPTPPPKHHRTTIKRKPLQAITIPSNTPRKSSAAATAPKGTLITTPLKFADSPLRPGETQRYDQQTGSWHVIAPKSVRKLVLAPKTTSPGKVSKVRRKPVQPPRFYLDMPGAFPRV